MSIRIFPSPSTLNTAEYFATKRQVTSTKGLVELGSECCFCVPNCDWVLPAFADLTDTDDRKNDKGDFLIRVASGSTVVGTLIKIAPDDTETDTIITDGTFGQFFDTGDLDTDVWGFILDWRLVAASLGFGKFKFNITVNNQTPTETFNEDSVSFQLTPWSCKNAHRTVRIETKQSGYFEDGFDYTNFAFSVPEIPGSSRKFPWPQQIRLWGRFHRSDFELEVDNIVSQDRGEEQVQSRTVKVYTLQLDTIETKLSNPLIRDMLQAPDVRISDYNINNIEEYTSTRVTMTDIDSPITSTMNKNEFFEIQFTEFFKANVHRYR